MFTIGKTFSFAAAHHLPQLPPEHKCHNVHGHNYLVTYELLSAELDTNGFVLDYAALSEHWAEVSQVVDHRDLNAVMDREPTAENLAAYLYDLATDTRALASLLVAVRVQETPTTFAEYRP